MSALTRFQPKFTAGNLRYHIDDTKVIDGYLECDGSSVLKNAYPELLSAIGYIKDNQTLSGTASTSGTLDIEDVIYANGTYVYVGENATIQTSNDGVTWTSRNVENPTYVGGTTFSRIGNTSTASVSLTSLTGGAASSPSANDIVFVAVATGAGAGSPGTIPVDGYVQIASQSQGGFSADTRLWTGYKIMGATPDTTITIPSTGSLDDAQTVAIQVWRNLSEYDLLDVPRTVATAGTSGIPNPPAITTFSNNTILLVVGAGGHTQGTQTFTASYLSNFLTVGANDLNDSTIGMGSLELTTAQTYDPAAFTFSANNSSFFSSASTTIALRPKRLHSVAYGNNIFVAVGNGGFLETSPDATTWTRRESGTANAINEVIFANNTFVYVGNTGTLATSTNGTDWTLRSSGTTTNIKSITFANTTNTFTYIADGTNGGLIGTSSDAITWTTQNTTSEITYVGGRIFSRFGSISTFNDSLTSLTGGVASSPSAKDVVFVAVATGSGSNTSQAVSGYTQIASFYVNGTTDTNLWVGYKVMGATPDTNITIPSTGSVNDAQTYAIQVWRNLNEYDLFDTVSTTSTNVSSVIVNPPSITTLTSNSVLLVIGAGGHTNVTRTFTASYLSNFLTTGRDDTNDSTIGFGSILIETPGAYDPAAWTFSGTDSANFSNASITIALKKSLSNNINNLIFSNNSYIVCGNTGLIATSTNALSWTIRVSDTTENINDLVYSDIDGFGYVGNAGVFATSSNGVTWTAATSGITNNINAVTYGSGGYTYVGDGGVYASASYYNYNPLIEFRLPTSNVYNIFVENENSYPTFTPRAYIKHE